MQACLRGRSEMVTVPQFPLVLGAVLSSRLLYLHGHFLNNGSDTARHVFTNNSNCSSTFWVNSHKKRTFVTYVQQSGYTTAYFGKYLNKYDSNR